MGVIHREMGVSTLVLYVLGVSVSSILTGLSTDALLDTLDLNVEVMPARETPELAGALALLSAGGLALFHAGKPAAPAGPILRRPVDRKSGCPAVSAVQ